METVVGIAIILIAFITFIGLIRVIHRRGAGRNSGRPYGSDSSSYSPIGFGDVGGFGGDGGGSCGGGDGGGGGTC